MPRLAELKGQNILICLLHQHLIEETDRVIVTRLVELENSGIWIEGKAAAEYLHKTFKKPMPKTPVFFVPFAQISWILSTADYPYLSEKSLGLESPEPPK